MDIMLQRNYNAMKHIIGMFIPEEPREFEDYICDDGMGMGPYKIKCTMWREGEKAIFDFAGTDPQAQSSVNFFLNEDMFKMFFGSFKMNEVEKPTPAAGEVLLRIHTCGLNFGDLLIMKGTYQEKPPLPATIGMELCGTVEALGAGVTHLKVGQKVGAYSGFGGLAEYVSVPENICVPLPDEMDTVDAAAFLIAYGTSHVGLDYKANLKAGERLLVLGASGGVGLTAVELGKLMGAEVIAVARNDEKLAICKEAGADHLINSETDDIREVVKSLGGADGFATPQRPVFAASSRTSSPTA